MKRKPLHILIGLGFILSSCQWILTPTSSSSLDFNSQIQPFNLLPPPAPSLQHAPGICEPTSLPRVSDNTVEEFNSFFHPTTKVMIDFFITKNHLAQINEFGNQVVFHDLYVPASMRIDVTPAQRNTISYCYPTVGLRMKGNFSRTDFINSQGMLHQLINLKVSFVSKSANDNRHPNQPFLGMDRLDLKWNRNFDHTHIRQVYAHKLFHDYLPLASQATLGGIKIIQTGVQELYRQQYLGIYTITEPIDQAFLRRRLGPGSESEGNLYKVLYSPTGPADFLKPNAISSNGSSHIQTGQKIGVENNPLDYHPTYDLKTNTRNPNFQDMVRLIGELNASQDVNSVSFRQRIEALVDIPSFIMMEAIAYFIGNPDDFRNNYNNLYLYFLPSNGKAYLIPYDLDRGFGSHGNWDPTKGTAFGPSLTKVTPFQQHLLKSSSQPRINPLHRLTVFQTAYEGYRQQYLEAMDSIFQSHWLQAQHQLYTGTFYALHQMYRSLYAPSDQPLAEVQPTGLGIREVYVPFSLTQTTEENLTYQAYLEAKLATYLASLS
jgi:hypothetical protein